MRLLEVAAKLKAEAGVRAHIHCKTLSGQAWTRTRRIKAPEGKDRYELYVLAHECGHLALGHDWSKPVHREEYEAERWAHEALERYGIEVPPVCTASAQRYVAGLIAEAMQQGQNIDEEAFEFAYSLGESHGILQEQTNRGARAAA